MGFKAYFDIAQRQAYACEGVMRQAWQSQLHKPHVPDLSWGWTGSQPSSCAFHTAVWGAFHTAVWGGCGWKVEGTPLVAALLRQLTKLQRCSCEAFWSFQLLASTNHPLSCPYTLCRCKGFWAVQHTESPSGLAGADGLCNGLRSLVLPSKAKWNTTYSSYSSISWNEEIEDKFLFSSSMRHL